MNDTLTLSRRGMLAIGLMVAFYGVTIGIAVGFLWIPYAEWTYLHRADFRIAVFCWVTAVTLLAAVLPRRDKFKPPGPRLAESSQTKLFSMIRSVADATKQEMPADVFLLHDVNAFVTYRGGMMGFGSRRVMGLGLPLMQGLTVSELKAVIAHEFGHYAAGDVALGPWIHKMHGAIARTMQTHSGSMLSSVFDWYGGLFMKLSLAISRQQEFVADAISARVVHPKVAASALRRVSGLSTAFTTYWHWEVEPALRAGYLPPIASGFHQFLGAEKVSEVMDRTVKNEESEPDRSAFDTHPPLRDRLNALEKIPAASAFAPDYVPASSLLQDADGQARVLLEFIAGTENTTKLRPTDWDQFAADFFPKQWRHTIALFPAFLSAHTTDAPPIDKAAYAKLGSSMPGGGTRSTDERIHMVSHLVASGVALALVDAGATIENRPGRPLVFRLRGASMEPFIDLPRVVSGELSLTGWQARCQAMGIAGRPLLSQSSATA